MIRIGIAACACVLLLAGCASASRQAPFPKHYALAAPAPAAAQTAGQAPQHRTTLRVARLVVPAWLEGNRLYYRLAYRGDDQIAAYADSDWVAPPAGMLERLIQNTLAGDGMWRIVVGPDNSAQTDFGLHIRLDDFSQVFTNPGQSQGVLDATATLVDHHNEAAMAQKRFHIQVNAPSADAAGGVKALNDASRQFVARLQKWLGTVPRGTRAPGPAPQPR
ncbi:MAG: ABC-type transport auxiliary lipoprotein family protein [Rhodanobacteraceae bacterium]